MGKIGNGYGSEWHMLRYLGRYRNILNQEITRLVGGLTIDWLDFPDNGEWKGLDFLSNEFEALRHQWKAEWPQSGNVMNWDAVGWLKGTQATELVLVEAKSHIGELKSTCGAAEHGGLPQIRNFLARAKSKFGAPSSADWLSPHYQYCNRLAMLEFLRANALPARLVLVYFTGDTFTKMQCPKNEAAWREALSELKNQIGLPVHSQLEAVHELFLSTKVLRRPLE